MIEFSSGSSKPKFLDGAALETWTIQAGEEENPCPRCSGKVSNAKIFENNFKTYKKQQHGSYRWIIMLENAQECGHLDLNALRAYYSWNESPQHNQAKLKILKFQRLIWIYQLISTANLAQFDSYKAGSAEPISW